MTIKCFHLTIVSYFFRPPDRLIFKSFELREVLPKSFLELLIDYKEKAKDSVEISYQIKTLIARQFLLCLPVSEPKKDLIKSSSKFLRQLTNIQL